MFTCFPNLCNEPNEDPIKKDEIAYKKDKTLNANESKEPIKVILHKNKDMLNSKVNSKANSKVNQNAHSDGSYSVHSLIIQRVQQDEPIMQKNINVQQEWEVV